MVRKTERIKFAIHGDPRGSLVAIESNKTIDFEIKRAYYIFDTKGDIIRGKHAHKDLKQVLICVNGSCDILVDDGVTREIIRMDTPTEGLYIHGLIWREMLNFSENCVLLALVNKLYDANDYIFDYYQFIKMVKDNVYE